MKHVLAIIVLAGLAWSFLPPSLKPVPPVPPVVGPVSVAMKPASKQDRQRVSAFYSALADVVERDATLIPTVGDFRSVHSRSLDAAFKGTDLPGKYPGLDAAIDGQLTTAVGKDDVPLPPAKRQALVQALKDVSNASR
jgi:hypothetical protein